MPETAANAMGAEPGLTVERMDALRAFVGAFVDELARSGLRHACVCPGSRLTPLALLLREHPGVRVWMHLDERSAAYFALGMAKASREPVAVVSTSGTAAVNFAPAVAEARYGRVPLIVLTADRPPELRDTGALQTIDQVRLYGSHVRWSVDLPLPEATAEAVRYARTVACRAVERARADGGGPAHVNLPFREPLIPSGAGEPPQRREEQRPYVTIETPAGRPGPALVAELAADLREAGRGLIVCGPQDEPEFAGAVARLAARLGWPLLADALSQTRCGPRHGAAVLDAYDVYLRDDNLAAELAPDVVLRFGALPVSKPLWRYLERHAGARQIVVDAGDTWTDPTHVVSDVVRAQPAPLCEALADATVQQSALAGRAEPNWPARWLDLDRRARAALRDALREDGTLSEPAVFAELADILPEGATLFAGNSMPVRDLDAFFSGSERPLRFLANRGVSGIDGVVSSALGASAVSEEPLTLVIGDLSFYHDMNGLLATKRHNLRATIVLLNNDGGGIFSFLPQAELSEGFEELFGTPHGLDFEHAARLYGLGYRRASSVDDFRAAMREALASDGVDVIEVRTDRRENVELHRRLQSSVAREIGGA